MFYPVIKYMAGVSSITRSISYPGAAKVFFKATVGAWGSLGSIAVFIALLIVIKNSLKRKYDAAQNRMTLSWFSAIFLWTLLYYAATKIGYFIPLLPFIILLAVRYLNKNLFRIFACCIIISSSSLVSIFLIVQEEQRHQPLIKMSLSADKPFILIYFTVL